MHFFFFLSKVTWKGTSNRMKQYHSLGRRVDKAAWVQRKRQGSWKNSQGEGVTAIVKAIGKAVPAHQRKAGNMERTPQGGHGSERYHYHRENQQHPLNCIFFFFWRWHRVSCNRMELYFDAKGYKSMLGLSERMSQGTTKEVLEAKGITTRARSRGFSLIAQSLMTELSSRWLRYLQDDKVIFKRMDLYQGTKDYVQPMLVLV